MVFFCCVDKHGLRRVRKTVETIDGGRSHCVRVGLHQQLHG